MRRKTKAPTRTAKIVALAKRKESCVKLFDAFSVEGDLVYIDSDDSLNDRSFDFEDLSSVPDTQDVNRSPCFGIMKESRGPQARPSTSKDVLDLSFDSRKKIPKLDIIDKENVSTNILPTATNKTTEVSALENSQSTVNDNLGVDNANGPSASISGTSLHSESAQTEVNVNNSVLSNSVPPTATSTPVAASKRSVTLQECNEPESENSSDGWVERQLMECRDGRFVLALFEQKGILFPRQRNILTKIIISNELEEDPSKIISRSRFMFMAREIVKRFPNEIIDTFYTPYKNHKGKKHPACGKLYDKYVSMKRSFPKLDEDAVDQHFSDDDYDEEQYSEAKLAELNSAVEWLKHNSNPQEDTLAKFRVTAKYRQGLFLKSNSNIYDYFAQFPALKKEDGFLCIDADFDILYQGKGNSLFDKWKSYLKNIIAYTKLVSHGNKDFAAGLTGIDLSLTDEKSELINSLLLLPLLLPSVNCSGSWKPSKVESRNGFLLHAKTEQECDEKIKNRNLKFDKPTPHTQPSAVIIGEVPNVESYVLLKNIKYKVDSPLKAIDVCFKIFSNLLTDYPADSYLCWRFIGKFLFEIGSSKKSYPSLLTLEKALNSLDGLKK